MIYPAINPLAALLFAALVTSGTTTARANEPAANAGLLTCTVEPAPAGATSTERSVSCRFEPIGGQPSSYTGTIKRVDGPPLVDANLVFAWTVLAPETSVPPRSLNGRYLSSLSDGQSPSAKKIGSLRGDGVVPIELRALTSAGREAKRRTLVLELELRAVRA